MIGLAGGLQRFGVGPRPGDLDAFTDIRVAVREEVETPEVALLSSPDLPDTGTALADFAAYRQMQAQGGPNPGDTPPPQRIYTAEIVARIARWHDARVGFAERLTAFWVNHFAIAAGSGLVERMLVGAFEREAIRPHVFGRFRDMLGAVTKHPAMLTYLNNAESVGPNSPAGRRSGTGLNENHARELMELHTIGVDAGYTQDDVIAVANILTGWTFVGRVRQGTADAPLGSFLFARQAHEPGAQTVLGTLYPDDGEAQGEALLDFLAAHPATARHVAFKLARHFVADDPPEALVDRLASTFEDTGGDLRAVSLALVDADEAMIDANKIKPPQLFLWSAIRALDFTPEPRLVLGVLQTLGQPMWNPPSPEGFSDESATWLAPHAITSRLDLAEQVAPAAAARYSPAEYVDLILGPDVSDDTRTEILQAESRSQAIALLLMSPEFQRT